jgi:DNA modification methylase
MPTLDWIGKKAVLTHHREVPYRLLKCDAALSLGDPGSGNLLVQGDNLLALKALLPYYAGKVKCIYIDPPYNTGNENWVYNDNVNSPEIRQWLQHVVGKEGEDLSRHDKWLCMMYPRLALLREFLSDDGIIFVSIDENEHRFLALVMDEIFGVRNHLETLIWKKSYGGGAKSKHIVNLHEYLVCFARDIEQIDTFELPPDQSVLKYYKFTDSKLATRGPYRLQPLATNSMDERPNLRYAIPYQGEDIWPEKQWQWSKDRVRVAIQNDDLVFAKKSGKWVVSYKQYLKSEMGDERSRKPYSIIDGIYTQQGTNEIKRMFDDGKAFSFPKPRALLELIAQIATKELSLVLDSFAGSGTTAHAVLAQNKADGGNRRFIVIEMDEAICRDVTAQRIRKAIEGYGDTPGLGGGFRYCKLAEPLFDASGQIQQQVTFAELAAHVYFTETGEPIPKRPTGKSSLIGVCRGTAYYLLFNGVLGDKRPEGGNVLTAALLAELPPHEGPRVIYGEGCRLGRARLERERIIFKQVPYEVKVS